jgi:hypothetical protein
MTLLREWISFTDQIKGQKELMEPLLRPLTQSQNSWVSLLGNIKLSERGLPADLKLKNPLVTYFQALQAFSPAAYEPDDPHFKKLFKDIDLKSATPAQVKEVFELFKDELKNIGPNPVPEHYLSYSLNQWRTLWEAAYKKYPMEMKALAREMAEDTAFRVTPRYMAMEALNESLKVQKDPDLVEFLLKKLADPERPVAYRAIFGLRDHGADDPRTPKAIAAYFDHTDDNTRQHAFAAFTKIKTSDPEIHHGLIRSLGKRQAYAVNALSPLRFNVPADSESARLLDEQIKVKDFAAAYPVEVRGLMPDRGKGSIEILVDALKNGEEGGLTLAAAKVLLGHPETKQLALDETFRMMKKMDLRSGFQILEMAEFLLEHDQHLPAVIERLQAVAAHDGGMKWKTDPLIKKIQERIRVMPAASAPVATGAKCPSLFGRLF